MNLTTKGRYAVTAMVDLALHDAQKSPVSLADIAARQHIALSYLEQLFVKLRRAGLVASVRGPGGGYKLTKASEQCFVSDIMEAVDEPIKMTRCNKNAVDTKAGCTHTKSQCLTHRLWEGLGNHIESYFQSVSLADICASAGKIKNNVTMELQNAS